MPYSRIVEQRYRLQPLDLSGPLLVVITNVTLQGLEQVRPILHFDRLEKRLMLDDMQSDELARITQSAVFIDWVGCEVMLSPVSEDDEMRIALSSPYAPPPIAPQNLDHGIGLRLPTIDYRSVDYRSVLHAAHLMWQALLVVALIVLLFAAFYALNNTELLWRYLGDLGFPRSAP